MNRSTAALALLSTLYLAACSPEAGPTQDADVGTDAPVDAAVAPDTGADAGEPDARIYTEPCNSLGACLNSSETCVGGFCEPAQPCVDDFECVEARYCTYGYCHDGGPGEPCEGASQCDSRSCTSGDCS